MPPVRLAEALGQQDLERLADQLAAVEAEHVLGGRVHQRDAPGRVDHHDALGGGFEEGPLRGFALA